MHGLRLVCSIGTLPLVILAYPAASLHTTSAAVDLDSLRLTSNSEYVNSVHVDTNRSVAVSAEEHYTDTAARLVQNIVPGASFRLIDDHFVGDNGVAHVYFRQTLHGIDIDNADFNVNVCSPITLFGRKLTVTDWKRWTGLVFRTFVLHRRVAEQPSGQYQRFESGGCT